MAGRIVLFGGPAGAGKSTLARAWCATRPRATLIELDDVRSLIVSGLADPQEPGDLQEEQYALSVGATCTLARTFASEGYDAAVADVVEPTAFEQCWRPQLEGCDWQLIILLPSLEETLARSASRQKRVLERHTREQHRRTSEWPEDLQIDTTRLSVEGSLELVQEMLTTGR
jgi:chloramphenicol 3-O-phosphotransferase